MISLITATYNSEAFLKSALASIYRQSALDQIEHIAVDGLSKDATTNIYAEIAPESQLISEKDSGLYDALNKGVTRAKGEFIGFCHADDVLAGDTVIEAVLKAFEENPAIGIVYGDLLYKDAQLDKTIRHWKSGKQASFKTGWMPPHPATFVRKSVFDNVGLFRTDIGSAADYEWLLRAFHIHKTKAYYLPKVLVNMRSGGISNANLAARGQGFKGDIQAWKLNTGNSNYWAILLKKLRKIPQYLKA